MKYYTFHYLDFSSMCNLPINCCMPISKEMVPSNSHIARVSKMYKLGKSQTVQKTINYINCTSCNSYVKYLQSLDNNVFVSY